MAFKEYKKDPFKFLEDKTQDFIKKYITDKLPSWYYTSIKRCFPILIDNKLIDDFQIKRFYDDFYSFGQTGDVIDYKYLERKRCKYYSNCFRKNNILHNLDEYHYNDILWSSKIAEFIRSFRKK